MNIDKRERREKELIEIQGGQKNSKEEQKKIMREKSNYIGDERNVGAKRKTMKMDKKERKKKKIRERDNIESNQGDEKNNRKEYDKNDEGKHL